jgi:ribulose-5-phosphate 4-epimerase/fuculose-1-phosphate aldolase
MYQPGDQQDMLVRNARFGTGLAETFARVQNDSQAESVPEHAVVLMRQHGYTTHGVDIETAVYRAIYTKINAGVLTNAMAIRSVFAQSLGPSNMPQATGLFEPLSKEMCEGCLKMNEGTQDKPWRLWVAEVEKLPLYTNNG